MQVILRKEMAKKSLARLRASSGGNRRKNPFGWNGEISDWYGKTVLWNNCIIITLISERQRLKLIFKVCIKYK